MNKASAFLVKFSQKKELPTNAGSPLYGCDIFSDLKNVCFLKLSSLLLGITDPFVPFENLFCAVVMGGLFDVIQVGVIHRTRISKKKTMLFAVVGMGSTRETREGWPLLTVETEANGDSGSAYDRVLPGLFRGLVGPDIYLDDSYL
jgi:hypothetical protein